MQTFITGEMLLTPAGTEANRILRSCVHCGFCTANCPTYRLLGDELDSPRGRIYLIKNMLEGKEVTPATQLHLDRCLTCRACETFCPSGVEYGHLLDIGRQQLAARVRRSWPDRWQRMILRLVLPYRGRFALLLRLGQLLRPVLPAYLRKMIPHRMKLEGAPLHVPSHARKVILFAGCVQPALSPQTNIAARQVLDRIGVQALTVAGERCCGALDYHIDGIDAALRHIRRNIDCWWLHLTNGLEAIVTTASGCGAMIRDYGYLLRDDPDYAEKAGRVSALARDISEIFSPADRARLGKLMHSKRIKTAFQNPCTLQHGQKVTNTTEVLLADLGFELCPVADSFTCCGSAGVYSLLQNEIAGNLRTAKIKALLAGAPEVITTANIGCRMHLQQVTAVPVRHWIEVVEEACRQEL